MKKYYTNYSKKIDFSSWPDPIDGLPDKYLEKADLILITHHHKDHCKAVTVNRLKKSDTMIIAPEICCKELKENIKTIKPGERLRVGKIEVKATFAYNTEEGSSTEKNHKKGECVGYLIKINSKIIYHAGDSDFIPEMKEFGKIDIALLPIGGIFTMNIPEATEAAIAIKPKVVIPMPSAAPCGHLRITSATKGSPLGQPKFLKQKSNTIYSGARLDYFLRWRRSWKRRWRRSWKRR